MRENGRGDLKSMGAWIKSLPLGFVRGVSHSQERSPAKPRGSWLWTAKSSDGPHGGGAPRSPEVSWRVKRKRTENIPPSNLRTSRAMTSCAGGVSKRVLRRVGVPRVPSQREISHRPHVLLAGHPTRSAPPSTSARSRPSMAVTDCSAPHGSPWRLHLAPRGRRAGTILAPDPRRCGIGSKIVEPKKRDAARGPCAHRAARWACRCAAPRGQLWRWSCTAPRFPSRGRLSGGTQPPASRGAHGAAAGFAQHGAVARHSPHALVDGAHAGSARPLQHTRRAALACSGGKLVVRGAPVGGG